MIAALPTQEQIDRIAQELAPNVVSIGFRIGRDWSDDPAIYFRVVLSDEASRRDCLRQTTQKVRETFDEKLNVWESTRTLHFNFRSQREQAKVQDDPRWD